MGSEFKSLIIFVVEFVFPLKCVPMWKSLQRLEIVLQHVSCTIGSASVDMLIFIYLHYMCGRPHM